MPRDELAAVEPVADALAAMGIEFHIGGSVASSLYGVARSTIDVDLVADIRHDQVDAFVARLAAAYYVDAAAIVEAIRHQRSFNLIHLATMYKIDIFVMKDRTFDQVTRRRTRAMRLDEGNPRTFAVASPEDTILSKLESYRLGGEVSERQWPDIVGVIRVQADQLDRAYLRDWAAELDVADLLRRALGDADA